MRGDLLTAFNDSSLGGWEHANVSFVASDGNEELGCVEVANGHIQQIVTVPHPGEWTWAFWYKATSASTLAITLLNADAEAVYTADVSITTLDKWVPVCNVIKLPPVVVTVKFSTVHTVKLDGVSLAHIPATRAEIARRVGLEFGSLVTELGIDDKPDGDATEGDYTNAITKALEQVGAIDDYERADVRWLEADEVEDVIEKAAHNMLPRLHSEAMLRPTSSSTGPVTDSYGLLSALEKRMGILPGMGNQRRSSVVSKQLLHDGD